MRTKIFMPVWKKILNEGREILGINTGIVSHIYNNKYEIVAVESKTNVFQPNEVYDLQDTYCREVYEKGCTIALTEIEGIWGLQKHPLYMALSLEAYISSPILVHKQVWGTVNFTSLKVREKKFSDDEVALVQGYAKAIGSHLEFDGMNIPI